MIPTRDEYFMALKKKNEKLKTPKVEYARVVKIENSKPILQFSGSNVESEKGYIYLSSYVPRVGDRVILLNNIILGGWQS